MEGKWASHQINLFKRTVLLSSWTAARGREGRGTIQGAKEQLWSGEAQLWNSCKGGFGVPPGELWKWIVCQRSPFLSQGVRSCCLLIPHWLSLESCPQWGKTCSLLGEGSSLGRVARSSQQHYPQTGAEGIPNNLQLLCWMLCAFMIGCKNEALVRRKGCIKAKKQASGQHGVKAISG